ncbi:PIG-L family deacetylase [bacterium]|nr:PIG-L family deacetylase [bacterium]
MHLHKDEAVVYLPGVGSRGNIVSADDRARLQTVTHLGIGAHPDDVEFMIWQGILQCYRHPVRHFASLVITDGKGSSRIGPYADCSDEQIAQIRLGEQHRVAEAGGYAASISLGYSSEELRASAADLVCEDIKNVVSCLRPEVIYTHNLADRHDSHVAALLRVVQALRELGPDYYPREFYGCEVWRSLDWLAGEDRCVCDVGANPNLMQTLMGLYDSQISGGKNYAAANFGRRQSNATYSDAYHADDVSLLELAMDLRPLLINPSLTPEDYFSELNSRFSLDVRQRLRRMSRDAQ